MSVAPVLQVWVGGQQLPDGSELPALLAGRDTFEALAVLDEVSVDWGGDSLVGHPDPATARLSLLDFSRRWATTRDVSGMPVELVWTATATDGAFAARTFFRGRLGQAEVSWVDVARPDGTAVRAARLDFTCESLEVDLANRFPTEASWPAETLTARAARLAGYATGVASAVRVREFWAGKSAAADAQPGQTSIRDHLLKLYSSCGADRMLYNPDNREYQSIGRQTSARRAMLVLRNHQPGTPGQPTAGLGAVPVPAVRLTATNDEATTAPEGLVFDARRLGYSDKLTKPATAGVTRAVLTYTDAGTGKATTLTRVGPAAVEANTGPRAVTVDSVLSAAADAGLNAEDVLAAATQEGGQWLPGQVTWDSRREGGFPTTEFAHVLLRGAATTYYWALLGSQLAVAGIRPVFSVIGGTITYIDRRWVVEATLAGWVSYGGGNSSPAKIPQHAISWEEVDPTGGDPAKLTRWGHAGQLDTFGMNPAVTYEDMRYVGAGTGGSIGFLADPGPDNRWDFYL